MRCLYLQRWMTVLPLLFFFSNSYAQDRLAELAAIGGLTQYNALPLSSNYIRSMQSLAENGDVRAQHHLAMAYDSGDGVKSDDEKAIYWYLQAAKQGYAESQYYLAIMYESGEGTPPDRFRALYWYRQAAEQGYSDAQNRLGLIYEDGGSLQADPTLAVYWYRKAAEQGDDIAQNNLARMYFNGSGVEQSHQMAYVWFSVAEMSGNEEAPEFVMKARAKLDDTAHSKAEVIKAEYINKFVRID